MTREQLQLTESIRSLEEALLRSELLTREVARQSKIAEAVSWCHAEESAVATQRLCELAAYAELVVAGAKVLPAGGACIVLASVGEAKGSKAFLAEESTVPGDGWTWPVRIVEAGWAQGSLEGTDGKSLAMGHYFPVELVTQVASSVNGVRFRRRHPETGDGSDAPELTAGWFSDGHMHDTAAVGTLNLLKSAGDIRSTLVAAKEAGQLDLFGLSIFGYITFKKSQIEGRPALVATALHKLIGVDFCAEAGAGGKFLQVAASRREVFA
jgi:hypothetical protein